MTKRHELTHVQVLATLAQRRQRHLEARPALFFVMVRDR